MVANPNSNLVFDFPDPTPRFEFNDSNSPARGNSPGGGAASTKKSKRFMGKFGKSKLLNNNSKNGSPNGSPKGSNHKYAMGDDSPSKQSVGSFSGGSLGGTATTATSSLESSLHTTLESSLNSSLGGYGYKYSGEPSRANSGDIAAGPLTSGGSSPSGSSTGYSPHFDYAAHAHSPKLQPKPYHSNPPSPGSALSGLSMGSPGAGNNAHRRHPSSANSTSGYISEVSEFSFDRVTVTTSGTNQSSNVSWGFLDDAVLNAVGAAQPAAGTNHGKTATNGEFVMVHTMEDDDADGRQKRLSSSSRTKKAGHRQTKSAGTFSNVSLSSEEDAIPFSGIVNDSAQSVISEISERTGGPGGRGAEGSSDAVQAILREGMENVQRKQNVDSSHEILTKIKETRGGKNTKDEMSSGSSAKRTLFADMQTKYTRFKNSRRSRPKEGDNKKGNDSNNKSPSVGVLHSIMEDVQFCGLYFCGIDTTTDGFGTNNVLLEDSYDDLMKREKEDRKKEADNTFLGTVIQCGNNYCGAL
mmetsp:Transcript_268/g.514  ORF Transcript_268/g.514 Transcript_268/m.514 type:complete len:525 (+) Transcript_268:287-1861(+)|eukprot:CAMPEP_0183733502 /NCGR_PEP_ID=MMETSP0737-20130205/41387_1 /TAXON_ID=385413 /ORGANISM="Thalassiosira miniscula, Strain CCMP1093" /LENGTH=524 /DNA_ID=CAMNT_0025966771 /DNA_START=274 /DNA_END=1848 /DNA_ORIENTATION=+